MPDKIRWGLLSTAGINDAVIDPIRRAARSELVAVASRDAGKARRYAEDKGIPKSFGSYEDMLADPELDVIYNPLPNSLHCEWTVKAANAGKHVLCEKPLAVELGELAQMQQAATANKVTVFEAFMYLHHPQTLQARRIIEDGTLGEVQTIHSWFHFYLPPERSENIRLNPDLSGGCLWDVGVYPNSLAITMAGDGPPRKVCAEQIVGESGVDVSLRAQMTFSHGTVAQISSSFRTPFREAAYVVGDRAILQIVEPWKPGIRGDESHMILTFRDGKAETIVTPARDPYLCEIEAMEDCILDGAKPVVTLEQSRLFLESALALYESARSGTEVTLQ